MSMQDLIAAVESKDPEKLKAFLGPITEGERLTSPSCECVRCGGTGWIPAPDKEANGTVYTMYAPCPCVEARRMRKIAEQSGLKAAMDVMTLKTFEQNAPFRSTLFKLAVDFLASPGKEWLYIGGQPGSGKTHICTAACVELLERGIPVRYMLWTDESLSILANRMDSEESAELLEPLKTVEVLYIDDLFKDEKKDGRLSPSPASEKLAFEIINARYTRKLRTIISSEWDLETLIDKDQATFSRVYQMCTDKYRRYIAPDKAKNWRLK
jgi:DNA replication protein DnaC